MWEGITEEHEKAILKLVNILPKEVISEWCLDSLPEIFQKLIAKDEVDNIKCVSWIPKGLKDSTFLLSHEDLITFRLDNLGDLKFIIERRKQ